MVFWKVDKTNNLKFHYKSRPSVFFYFGILFFLSILLFTSYNLVEKQLTLSNLLFLMILAFVISYVFAFRFSCKIDLTERTLRVFYYFKDEKSLRLSTDSIVSFDKHEDVVHRYFKKLLINTHQQTFLIKYNISDSSNEELCKLLTMIVEKNKKKATKS